tara:strand:- start:1268 stop:1480 length:213 start_codon:yes stop_codon:yes gene_type:complete
MELIDTPNPNAKKVMTDLLEMSENEISRDLSKIEGVSSVFFGPGFVTVTKEEKTEWESINQDIINIFDKL